MAAESIPAFLQLSQGLTRVRCECCAFTGHDPVAHLLVAEAVLVGMRERQRVTADRERAEAEAWAEARKALEEARGGR
jgi:LSD1 subclass zinc finger protein